MSDLRLFTVHLGYALGCTKTQIAVIEVGRKIRVVDLECHERKFLPTPGSEAGSAQGDGSRIGLCGVKV